MVTLDHLAVLLLTRLLWTSLQAVMLVGIVALVIRLVPRLPATARCTLWWLVGLQVVLGLCWQAPIRVPLLTPAPTVSIAAPQRTNVATGAPADTAMSSIVETPMASGASASSQHVSTAGTTKYVAGDWPVWLASLWILALLLQLPTIIMQRWRLRGLTRAAKPPVDRTLQIRCARASKRLGLRRCPVVQVSVDITSPLVTGFSHPVILWPAENALTPEESSLALAHELAHLQRGDLSWSIVPALAQWLFFFHPLVRRAVREFALYREAACDAQVLQQGTAPHDYGSLLLRLGVAQPLHPGLGGASPTFHNLKRRLLMLGQTTSTATRARGWLLVIVILAAALPYRVVAVSHSVASAGDIASTHTGAARVPPPPPPSLPPVPSAAAAPPLAGPTSPPAPPPPALPDTGFHARNVDIDTDSNAQQGTALFDGDSIMIQGTQADLASAKRLYKANHQPLLWFRRGDKAYVIRDRATIDRAKDLYAPMTKFRRAVADLDGKKWDVKGPLEGLHSWQRSVEAQRRELSTDPDASGTKGRIASLATQRHEIDARTAKLDQKLAALKPQLDAMARRQQQVTTRLDQNLSKLLDDALDQGRAQQISR